MISLASLDHIIVDLRRLFLSDNMSEPEKSKKKSKKAVSRVVQMNPSKKRKLEINEAMMAVQTMQNSLDNLRETIIPNSVCDLTFFLIRSLLIL